MKFILALFLSFVSSMAIAQDYVKKRVVSEEGIPLAYATIRLLPGAAGTIANEDGFFSLPKEKVRSAHSLQISHLGFKSIEIPSPQIEQLPLIILAKEPNELSEVNISADSEKHWATVIFEAFEKRRNSSLEVMAKGKLTVRSYLENQPIEILEGEGLVKIDETGVPKNLEFSFIETNVDPINELRFFSIHTSSLISQFSPFERTEVSPWPLHPGRLGKRKIYKEFSIDLVNYNHETGISKFELKSKSTEFLSAKIWLNEDAKTILRYEVFGEKLKRIPLESIIEGRSINDFSMQLTFDFGSETNRLNYLLWKYSFDYGTGQKINTVIKMPVENGPNEMPVFLVNTEYHDYAMAAILPKPTDGMSEKRASDRSDKDREALQALQSSSSTLNVGLVFWNRDEPFDISQIPENKKYRKDSYSALGNPSGVITVNEKFKLAFNSVLYRTGSEDYSHRTFFDQVNSSLPVMEDRETDLLVNLLFDEYHYTAQRIVSSSTNENMVEISKSERKELLLRKDRLLMNSRGGLDLPYLLERNFANFELHGIDRFDQLKNLFFESWMFHQFERHLNPAEIEDLALAYLIVGDYEKSLNALKTISQKSAAHLYLEALNYYYKNKCEEYVKLLAQAKAEGFAVPAEAEALCH